MQFFKNGHLILGPDLVCAAMLQNLLQAGLIIAGWDKHEGGSVYAVPLGGTLVKTPFSIGTAQSFLILDMVAHACPSNSVGIVP